MLIETRSITYSYPDRQDLHFPDMQSTKAERVLVEGISGSGKTTLLHLLAGIIRPKTGSIRINDTDITRLKPAEMDAFRGKHIGMVFQQHFFLPGLHVMENLVAAQKLPGLTVDMPYLERLLSILDIIELKTKMPAGISQGEQQRFSIARALANRPLIVLADEPTSSLDDQNCTRFIELIRDVQNETKTTWVIATHDQRLRGHFRQIYSL